jgi:PAS domain S-box-containing protein
MLRRRFKSVLFFVAAMLFVAQSSVQNKVNAQKMLAPASTSASTEVIFAVPRNFPPYHYTSDTGEVSGFAIDIAKAIEKRSGLKFTFKAYPTWAAVMSALKEREATAIANIGISPKRASALDFSVPYDTLKISYFIRATDTKTKTSEALIGRKIGVVGINRARSLLQKLGKHELVVFNTNSLSDAIFALISSQVDAVAYPEHMMLKTARSAGVSDRIRVVNPPLIEVLRGMAVRKGDAALLAKINAALEPFIKTKEFQTLYKKWFGAPAPYWNATRVAYLVISLSVVALIAFLILRYFSVRKFNRRLQQTIREKTATEIELVNIKQNLENLVADQTKELRQEIAERRELEESLVDNERRIRAIVETASDAVITADTAGVILEFNSAAEEIFGHTSEFAIGENVSILIPNKDTTNRDRHIKEHLSGPEKSAVGFRRTDIGVKRDGSTFPIEVSLSRADTHQGRLFTAIIRDITERKRAEDELHQTLDLLRKTQNELVQSEKMASLGELVAGVAHEINTPVGIGVTAASHLESLTKKITAAFGSGSISKRDFEVFLADADESTKLILANLHRAATLIQSFKQVAVDHSSEEKRNFNVLPYVREIIMSLAPRLRQSNAELKVEGDEDIVINSYPGAISQIVTNLILNSLAHAFEENDNGKISINASVKEGSVHLEYEDNGCGLSDEVINKIYDPFFTTKRGQGGSGLGMNIVYNLVTQRLRGAIHCESELGQRTKFSISFPFQNGVDS